MNSFPKFLFALVAFTALADFLFFRQQLGWNGAFFLLALWARQRLAEKSIGSGAHSAMLNHLFAFFALGLLYNPCAFTFVLGLVTIAVREAALRSPRGRCEADRIAGMLSSISTRALVQAGAAVRWFTVHASMLRISRVRGWFLPLCGSAVFAALFLAGNPVLEFEFAFIEHHVALVLDEWLGNVTFLRILSWFSYAYLLWGFLRYRGGRKPVPTVTTRRLDTALIERSLLLFNLVFAANSYVDLVYLWGGKALPAGMTYATYAHRGAYTLIVTALLAGAFVIVASAHRVETVKAYRLLQLWILQNVLLMASTMWRLFIYIEVYQLSLWRVSTVLWVGLTAFGFASAGWKIARGHSNRWLIGANGLAVTALFAVIPFLNLEGVVAWYNVLHSKDLGGLSEAALDIEYLESLGPEALPALEYFKNQGGRAFALEKTLESLRAGIVGRRRDFRSTSIRIVILDEQFAERSSDENRQHAKLPGSDEPA